MAVTFSAIPFHQMWTMSSYVLKQKLKGKKRYPIVLMLEPLFRCNLACAGCGKIQYPGHILKKNLSVEQCRNAAIESGAPVVSLPGGEPLMHPEIGEITQSLVDLKRYVYVCTNALLLEEKLDSFKPSPFLTFSIHMDGPREEHDFAVCREGTYDVAVNAIKEAVKRGFRVTTNTTLFAGADAEKYHTFFDDMMALGVEGMTISPGYSYQKAPDQEHFMLRKKSAELFRSLLQKDGATWRFNQSPLFLDFLMGYIDFECTPWGNVTYNIFGWQRPCYLLQEGYVQTFKELMEDTEWDNYGRRSGNEKCKDCAVHCGFEASSVDYTFGSWKGFTRTAMAALGGRMGKGDPENPIFAPANRPNKKKVAQMPQPIPAAAD